MKHPEHNNHHKKTRVRAHYHRAKSWFQSNKNLIGGVAIFIGSLFLIAKSINFLMYFAAFIAGLILLYYSLKILKLHDLVAIIDRQLLFLKNKFFK